MEDFLLRHKHRREKNVRRMYQKAFASKAANEEEKKKNDEQSSVPYQGKELSTQEEDGSPERFQFVGIGDDVRKILASNTHTSESTKNIYNSINVGDCPEKAPASSKYRKGGWWYRRTKPRIYPTVVVAEYIEKRDEEKDCSEDVNVYCLSKTITIRNSGIFVDDGICTDIPEAVHNSKFSDTIVYQNKDSEPNIMSLIQNDEVIKKFFAPLLKDTEET
ncbi:hypothetical protein GCK32_000640 [Trichostrongylus colubriformis]|uniref:Uncharacterized protein n=1 Tax=Trichostrongylus colubriformis TaxID=6319 RepID=A0AAN8G8Z0_TRICO